MGHFLQGVHAGLFFCGLMYLACKLRLMRRTLVLSYRAEEISWYSAKCDAMTSLPLRG